MKQLRVSGTGTRQSFENQDVFRDFRVGRPRSVAGRRATSDGLIVRRHAEASQARSTTSRPPSPTVCRTATTWLVSRSLGTVASATSAGRRRPGRTGRADAPARPDAVRLAASEAGSSALVLQAGGGSPRRSFPWATTAAAVARAGPGDHRPDQPRLGSGRDGVPPSPG